MSNTKILTETIKFLASNSSGEVSGLLLKPQDAQWLLVYGHGAGAPMEHPFMQATSEILSLHQIATLRYNFPYMENKKGRPDPPGIAQATVRSAVNAASELAPDLKLLAGGKSFGGRMTSQAAAADPLPGVRGLIFFGFPLHAPGRPSSDRATHLQEVKVPMLFLQGTRDALANLEFLQPVCENLTLAHLHKVEGGDHSFRVPKSMGISQETVYQGLGNTIEDWVGKLD
ncbi:MAG: alpha/beta hydrolase [Bacteroidetes bacterium]|nr:alpha/beta hydrolase [Bacteroidota bacterium]